MLLTFQQWLAFAPNLICPSIRRLGCLWGSLKMGQGTKVCGCEPNPCWCWWCPPPGWRKFLGPIFIFVAFTEEDSFCELSWLVGTLTSPTSQFWGEHQPFFHTVVPRGGSPPFGIAALVHPCSGTQRNPSFISPHPVHRHASVCVSPFVCWASCNEITSPCG